MLSENRWALSEYIQDWQIKGGICCNTIRSGSGEDEGKKKANVEYIPKEDPAELWELMTGGSDDNKGNLTFERFKNMGLTPNKVLLIDF